MSSGWALAYVDIVCTSFKDLNFFNSGTVVVTSCPWKVYGFSPQLNNSLKTVSPIGPRSDLLFFKAPWKSSKQYT